VLYIYQTGSQNKKQLEEKEMKKEDLKVAKRGEKSEVRGNETVGCRQKLRKFASERAAKSKESCQY